MLSEGVDMPFLRRLAIRHARGSRVEYAQEIGRVLRATAGKSYALVYDPWQVTLTHQIQSPVEVAEAIEAQPKAKPAEPPGLCIDPLTGLPIEWADLPAKDWHLAPHGQHGALGAVAVLSAAWYRRG
jgi:hypothetical protein